MNSPLKSAVLLLFALMLAFAGIGEGMGMPATPAASLALEQEEGHPHVFQGEQTKSQLLHKSGWDYVSTGDNLPVPVSKGHSNYLLNLSHALEHTMQCQAMQYLFQSKRFSLSLSGSDIIFPFHYFW
ncbi:hypothetical protein [Pontibacter sp. SGAir0037]|uniref:hypothetical protein n=1 Tax=Pontibacter sp. SGAir0037 TaxID=2571030 RepID=UPI0010CD0B3D|nr:hypothetical protein [Pontibacter sp. SGAir0037]QCR21409.1 hypothetical protein C1N53_02955 [Pontibacter sp. SGAir0037]